MRFKLGWKPFSQKRRKMHKGVILTIFCFIAVQTFIPEINGLKTLRLRGRQFGRTTTTPTTALPSTTSTSTSQPLLSSSEFTTSLPAQISSNNDDDNDHPKPTKSLSSSSSGRRRRIRVKKFRVQKRQGSLSEEVGSSGGGREPLYQEHADEIHVPDHYYSPIRRQRMRGNKKLFSNPRPSQSLEPINEQQQYHKSAHESQSPSNVNFRTRLDRERVRSRFPVNSVVDDHTELHHDQPENDEEYNQQTQPAPKNYAFAYAVRDDGNTEDNNFSHKEARDGQLTMGEYRINLPDGRVQVVRYTAGGKIGYKADVTYEGEGDDHPKKQELTSKPTPYTAGNQGYLPPSLSNQSPVSSTPSPKKYRKKQRKRYQSFVGVPFLSSPRPTSPYNNNQQQEDADFNNNYKQQYQREVSESDKYYDGGQLPQAFYYNKSPSSTLRPGFRRIRPTSNYESYPESSDSPPTPTVYNNIRPTKSSGRPLKSKVGYEKISDNKEQQYDENLALLHEHSPRAGPNRHNAIGGHGYPGQSELEEEIQNLYKPQKPQSNNFNPFKNNYQRQRKSSQQNVPADLYNEPGPGNYYTSVNGPPIPSSPTPTQFPKYPKPVFKSSSTPTPKFNNYIDDNDDHDHHHEDKVDDAHLHHQQYQRQIIKYAKSEKPNFSKSIKQTFGGYTPISFKSGQGKDLIPIEEFKAGPLRKNYKTTTGNSNKNKPQPYNNRKQQQQNLDHYYDDEPTKLYRPSPQKEPESVRYKEPYQYYNSQHPSFHHGGYIPPAPPAGLQQQFLISSTPSPSPTPATSSSYTIDFPGGKHSFYLKTGPGSSSNSNNSIIKSPFNRPSKYYHESSPTQSPSPQPRKKSLGNGSGLVFFETPGVGPRPTAGVKNILSQFPSFGGGGSSTPPLESYPNTVIHPYEVGSKDYGQSVGYKNSFNSPSSGEHDNEHDNEHQHQQQHDKSPHGHNEPNVYVHLHGKSRDYLFENGQEEIVNSSPRPRFRSRRPIISHHSSSTTSKPAQYHYEKIVSPSPSPHSLFSTSSVSSTPESFQDIDYQVLQPVSPTPAISTSHFHQPILAYPSSSSSNNNGNFGLDPRHAGDIDSEVVSPLRFSTISEDVLNNSDAVQQQQPDLTYQYQYEDGVK